MQKGVYQVIITDKGSNCTFTLEDIGVDVDNTVDITITSDKSKYCPDEKVNLFGKIEITPGDKPFDAEWKFSDNRTEQWTDEEAPVEYDATGNSVTLSVTILLTAPVGSCTFTKEFNATLGVMPHLEFEKDVMYIPEDTEEELLMTIANWGNDDADSYEWKSVPSGFTNDLDDPRGTVWLKTPEMNQPYSLILILKKDDCLTSDTIGVERALKIVPTNVFTPNGDDKNPVWKFRNLEHYTNHYRVKVAVFNRGGSVVFSSDDYTPGNEWNGTRSGQDVPTGNYSFVVEIINRSSGKMFGKPITGSVTIMR